MRGKEDRRPTIVDVAKLAGVSKSTVARALGDGAEVNEETRARVRKAATAAGYERNHLAVGMRSGRSGMLGLIVPDIADPLWGEVARGAQDRAVEAGASLLIFSSGGDEECEAKHIRSLRQARVDGAMVNPVSGNADAFSRYGLPFVLIGSSAERFEDHASVGADIVQAVKIGMDHLVFKGYPAPSLILGRRFRIARARFLWAVHEHCLERDVDPAVLPAEDGGDTYEGGYLAMQRLLQQSRGGPFAVFAASDMMGLGAMRAVRDVGKDCPRDVSILGFDGIPASAFSWPGLTTIEKPTRELGYRATDELLNEIAGAAPSGRTHLPCRLIERGSIAELSPPSPPRPAVRRGAKKLAR